MNTSKSLCFYHKDQLITNFCRDKNCLMPLCPNCIGEHSIYHEQNNSKPQYTSIFQTLSEVQKLIYNAICSFEADRSRMIDLTKAINSVQGIIEQKLSSAKLMVYNVIEETFKDLEKRVGASLKAFHDEVGLYSSNQTQKYQEQLIQNINELYEMHEGLKGSKCLGHSILFLKQKDKQYINFHANLNTFLDLNEQYQPKIQINSQSINSLSSSISRLLRVEGKKEFDKRKEKEKEDKYFVRRSQKDFNEKNEKIERSYTPQRSAAYLKTVRQYRQNPPAPKMVMNVSHSPYLGKSINHSIEPMESTIHRQHQLHHSTFAPLSQFDPSPQQTNRKKKDFKLQYELLSQKVNQMRKQNQMRPLRYNK